MLPLPKGNEVITTPYMIAFAVNAIIRHGLKSVFCDISYQDYNIDVTKKSRTHRPFCRSCGWYSLYVAGFDRIAKKYDLNVIYDILHVFIMVFDGRFLITFRDVVIPCNVCLWSLNK